MFQDEAKSFGNLLIPINMQEYSLIFIELIIHSQKLAVHAKNMFTFFRFMQKLTFQN